MSNLEIVMSLKGRSNIRLGVDASRGHGCFSPTIPATAAITVFTDQIAEVRVSDKYVPHCCKGCHTPVVVMGARITYTEMLPTHRSTDKLSCGDTASNGSISTFSDS